MEAPHYPNMDEPSFAIDPTLSFQFPQSSSGLTPLPQTMADSSYQPDVFSQSYLQDLPAFNPDDNLFDGMLKSSHDDLDQFFNDASFGGGGTPDVAAPGTSRLGDKLGEPLGNSWLRNVQQSAPDWEGQNGNALALAVDTSDNVEQRETLVKNGQVTPGNSPSSPKSAKSQQTSARKTRRPRKASTKALEGAVAVALAPSGSGSDDGEAPAQAPAKRARKSRENARKPPTPEEEAAKRETFLKRNREAAYKCRIKKKTQTEMIIERAKQLDADNAVKELEFENLMREVKSMRAMLLPHWRTCADENVNEYVDGLVKEGWGLGKMVLGAIGMGQREAFDVGEGPREDDGMNGHEMNMSPTESAKSDLLHPRSEAVDEDTEEPAHKRRRSEAVFEMSMDDFKDSIAVMDGTRQRRESFFGNSLAPEEVLKDALGAGGSLGSSGSATPASRLGGVEMLNEEFLVGNTPPPLDLSAPDEQRVLHGV